MQIHMVSNLKKILMIFLFSHHAITDQGSKRKNLLTKEVLDLGKILEGAISGSDKKNWSVYVDFSKNCKKITPPGQSSFAQNYQICTAENIMYQIY